MVRDLNGALDLAHGYVSGGAQKQVGSVEAAQALLSLSMMVLTLTKIIEREALSVDPLFLD